MAWGKSKTRLVAGIIAAIVLVICGAFVGEFRRSRLRLPTGKGTPVICLGERQGFILASDGSLWTWGSDLLGWPVLGLGSNTLKSTMLRRIGHDTNWIGISAGSEHSLGLKSDGTIWIWGRNQFILKPIYTPVPAVPGNDWKQIAAGGAFSVALKTNGTLWAWGHNEAGELGDGTTNNSGLPVQVGSATNWVKVWAGYYESVGIQSDGSLWYWGENPSPTLGWGVNPITSPKRISPDTNWVDAGFGTETAFAIKSNGTLWVWGRNADRYTGAKDPAQSEIPTRIGTNSDWQSISATLGWWITGLTKKDGSLWVMDASSGNKNGLPKPYQPVQFKRIDFHKSWAAYADGGVHAAPAGVHGEVGVILTPDGEVWTWGMEMGDPLTFKSRLETIGVNIARRIHPAWRFNDPDPDPVFRDSPWQLRNTVGN